jgi:16S rRNA G966 N2-methylase RsmD
MDVSRALATIETPLNIAFIDPPYERGDVYQACLDRFAATSLLAAGGILVFEHSKRITLPDNSGHLRKFRSLVQGDAALAFYTA